MALNFAQISRCVSLIVTSRLNTTGGGFRARSLTRRYHKYDLPCLSTVNPALLSRSSRCGWYPATPMVGPLLGGLFCQPTSQSHTGIPARSLKTCGPSGGATLENSPSLMVRALQGKKYFSYLTKRDEDGNKPLWSERSKLRRPRIVSSSATNLHSDFKVQKMFKSVMGKNTDGNCRTAEPVKDAGKITNQKRDLDLEKVKGEPSGNTGKTIKPSVNRDSKNKTSKYKPNRTRTTFIKIPSDSKKFFDLSKVEKEIISQSVIPASNMAVDMVKCFQTCMQNLSSTIQGELTGPASKATKAAKKQLKETRQEIKSTMQILKRTKSCPENREVVEIYTGRSGRSTRKVVISISATNLPKEKTKIKGKDTEKPDSETAKILVQQIQKGNGTLFAQNDFQINRNWDKIKEDIEKFQDQRSSQKNSTTLEQIGKSEKANIIEIRPRYVVNEDATSNRDVGPRLTCSGAPLSRPDPRPHPSFVDKRKANSRESRAATNSQPAISEFTPDIKNATQETGFILLDHQYTNMAKSKQDEKGFILVNETGTAEKGFTLVKNTDNAESRVTKSEQQHRNFVLINDNLKSPISPTQDSATTTHEDTKLVSTDGNNFPMPEVSGDARVMGTSLWGNKELYSKTEQFANSKLFNQNLNQPIGPSDSTEELKQPIRNNEAMKIPTKSSDCDNNLNLGSEPLAVKINPEVEWTTTEVKKAEVICEHLGNVLETSRNIKCNEKTSSVSVDKVATEKTGSAQEGVQEGFDLPSKDSADYSWTCVNHKAEDPPLKSALPSHCHRETERNKAYRKEKSSRSGTPKKSDSVFFSWIDPSGYILKGRKPTAATVSDLKPDLQKDTKKTQRKKSDSAIKSRSEPKLYVKPEEMATAVKKSMTKINGPAGIDKATIQSQSIKGPRTNLENSQKFTTADLISITKSSPRLTRQSHDKAEFESLTNKSKAPSHNAANSSSDTQPLQNVNENKPLADIFREMREESTNTSLTTKSQASAHKTPPPIITTGRNLELMRAIREQWSKDFQDTYRRYEQSPSMYSPDHKSNRNCSSTSSQDLGRNFTKYIKNKSVRSKSPKSKTPQITVSVLPGLRSPKKTETPIKMGMAERLSAASKQPAKTLSATENDAVRSESSVTTFTDATITQGTADDFPDVDQFEEWAQNNIQETYTDKTRTKPNVTQESDLPPKFNLPDGTKLLMFDPTKVKLEGSSVDKDLSLPGKRTSSRGLVKFTQDAPSGYPSIAENPQDQGTLKDSPIHRPSTISSPIDINLSSWERNFPESVPDREVSPPVGWKQQHHQSRKDNYKTAASTNLSSAGSPGKDLIRKTGEVTNSASSEGRKSRNAGSLDGLVSMTVLDEEGTRTSKLKPTLKRSLSRERGEEKRVSFNPKLLNTDMLNMERKTPSSSGVDGEHAETGIKQHLIEDSSVGDMAARGTTNDLRKVLAQDRKQAEMEARITLINKHTKQIKEYEAMLSKYRNVVSQFKDATMKNIKDSSRPAQPQKFTPE